MPRGLPQGMKNDDAQRPSTAVEMLVLMILSFTSCTILLACIPVFTMHWAEVYKNWSLAQLGWEWRRIYRIYIRSIGL